MRNKYLYFWYFIMISSVINLWSCSSGYKEYSDTGSYSTEEWDYNIAKAQLAPSMESTFSAEAIEEFQLEGFEQRAVEKLFDLGDYVSAISNLEYDRALREHMMEQALELFEDSQSVVKMDGFGLDFTSTLSITRFLKGALNNEYGLVEMRIDDAEFIEDLVLKEDSTYRGIISCTQSVQRIIEDEISVDVQKGKLVSVMIMKVKKDFGDKKEQVWEVRLGTIE